MGIRDALQALDIPRICRATPALRLPLVGVGLVVVACTPPQAPAQPTISLRVRGTPASATVIVDEEALGTLDFVAAHGVALPPGVHHVTVKALGYFPSDAEVDARPGSPPVRLEFALTPVPD
jgi:PEGA domain